jgi:hypothetical protein
MKKTILVLVLFLGLAFGVFCQASGPIDLVVLLDNSAGMSSYYRETSVVGPFLREFLRIGDTFHLISFSGTPRLEISRRIEGIGDVETIIARLLLMYPLYPQSNLGEALAFAERYTASLPGGRPGRLILLSDGSAANTQNLISETQERLRNQRTDFQYIQIPVALSDPSALRPTHTQPAAQIETTQPTQPSAAGQQEIVQGEITAPPPRQEQPGITDHGTAVTGPGQQAVQTPSNQIQQAESRPGASEWINRIPLPLLIALAILALLAIGIIIIFSSRRLSSSPNTVMARAAAPVDNIEQGLAQRKPLPKDKVYTNVEKYDGGPLMLNLFVEDQNTAIGRRNIHSIKSGYTLSLGGGRSDFLIFLVPLPPNIANVHYDGRNCNLIPLRPQYFPDIGSQTLYNCIGKTIRVISDKNYELHIRIDMYEDPLKVLNRLMNSISVPGPAK